jgi:hypothetical protein
MKNLTMTLTLIAAVSCANLLAQAPGEPVNKEKMKVVAGWIGRWQGEGWMQMGPGEPKKSSVDEKIESKLDGTVMLVEGIGKAPNASGQETVVHHALAVLSYDQQSGQYKFKSYLKDGRSTEAWFNVTGENKFQWGFDIPNRGNSRYTIGIDTAKKTWSEIGEFSPDGTTWSKFLEMNLKKTE